MCLHMKNRAQICVKYVNLRSTGCMLKSTALMLWTHLIMTRIVISCDLHMSKLAVAKGKVESAQGSYRGS